MQFTNYRAICLLVYRIMVQSAYWFRFLPVPFYSTALYLYKLVGKWFHPIIGLIFAGQNCRTNKRIALYVHNWENHFMQVGQGERDIYAAGTKGER